jgi:hypothetical protein
MNRKEVMEMFNKRPRIGALATSSRNGEVNAAVFGSPQMIDENTIVMGIGRNRSLQYLQENPHAAFIVMEPGENPMQWKGIRVYLKVAAIETEGALLENLRTHIAKVAGEKSAKAIYAAIRFTVTDVRSLIAPA